MKRFVSWCAAMVLWLRSPIWLFLALIALPICMVGWLGCSAGVRNAGTALQILGVATVYLNLRGTRDLFDLPKIFGMIRAWLARRPQLSPPPIVGTLVGGALGSATLDGRGRFAPPKDATIEKRVETLEQNYAALFDEVGMLGSNTKRDIKAIRNELKAEASQRTDGDRKILKQLQLAVADPASVQHLGIVFFAAGIILGTSTDEVSGLLRWVGSCAK